MKYLVKMSQPCIPARSFLVNEHATSTIRSNIVVDPTDCQRHLPTSLVELRSNSRFFPVLIRALIRDCAIIMHSSLTSYSYDQSLGGLPSGVNVSVARSHTVLIPNPFQSLFPDLEGAV